MCYKSTQSQVKNKRYQRASKKSFRERDAKTLLVRQLQALNITLFSSKSSQGQRIPTLEDREAYQMEYY